MRSRFTAAAPLAVGAAMLFSGAAQAHEPVHAVYTQTNSAAGNVVEILAGAEHGSLYQIGSIPTGGTGTSAGLGSQGAVALSDNGRVLLAVDAGSNDIASFQVDRRTGGLTLAGRVPSRGTMPVSVAIHGNQAYVLNAGAIANVASFKLANDGTLTPRFGGRAPLSTPNAGAAEVAVAPDGSALIVTEKQANQLETFPIERGRPGDPVVTPSNGPVPFGFAFDRRGDAIVSEAANSTASAYRINSDGTLRTITASAATNQGAACWVAVTPDGRFAYTGNAATNNISRFGISPDGTLTLLDRLGEEAGTTRPNDLAIAGGFLYAVNPSAGGVSAYRIAADGRLTPVPGAVGLPHTLAGLAAS